MKSRFRFASAFVALMLALGPTLSGCGHLFFYPRKELFYPPEKQGLHPETFFITTEDKVKLHAWFFSARSKPRKGTVVQFHGNGENLSSHYLSVVWLIDNGYDVFTFDYRGYGVSEGEPNPEGAYRDGMAALKTSLDLHAKHGRGQFVIVGQSLGGLIALKTWVDFDRQSEGSLMVLESTFSSYKDIAQEKLAGHWMTWLFSPLGRVLVSDRYASQDSIAKLVTPLVVIHDEKDPVVPFHFGEEIFAGAASAKNRMFFKEAKGRHVGFFSTDAPENRKKLIDVLKAL